MNEKLTEYFNIDDSTKSQDSKDIKLHKKTDNIQVIIDDNLIEKKYVEKISSTDTDKKVYDILRPKRIILKAKLEQ